MTRRPLPLANAATFAAFVAAASDPRGRPTTDVRAWPEGYPATDWRIARAETLAGAYLYASFVIEEAPFTGTHPGQVKVNGGRTANVEEAAKAGELTIENESLLVRFDTLTGGVAARVSLTVPPAGWERQLGTAGIPVRFQNPNGSSRSITWGRSSCTMCSS